MDVDRWRAVAEQARTLAAVAELAAQRDPRALAPEAGRDPLGEMHTTALDLVAEVAACRRGVWAALRDQGLTMTEIAAMWGVRRSIVSRALSGVDVP